MITLVLLYAISFSGSLFFLFEPINFRSWLATADMIFRFYFLFYCSLKFKRILFFNYSTIF